ncbi:MAG: phospholipid scramblase-related protein [Candidatus Sumerlaeia bacterium]
MNIEAGTANFVIQQKKEMLEVFSGFETRNQYEVRDASGSLLFLAGEIGRGFFARQFLQSLRPFTIELVPPGGGSPSVRVERPFRFFFQHIDVHGPDGRLMGSVTREFAILERRYVVKDAAGNEVLRLFGPILHPWTFHIQQNGENIGKITKKWSGFLKEAFTDADNFAATFPESLGVEIKTVLLGAVFLIDFAHFERRSNNN